MIPTLHKGSRFVHAANFIVSFDMRCCSPNSKTPGSWQDMPEVVLSIVVEPRCCSSCQSCPLAYKFKICHLVGSVHLAAICLCIRGRHSGECVAGQVHRLCLTHDCRMDQRAFAPSNLSMHQERQSLTATVISVTVDTCLHWLYQWAGSDGRDTGRHQCHWHMNCDESVHFWVHTDALLIMLCQTPIPSACAGKNWVDPPKRERKRQVNYAENEYFRNALKAPGRAPGGPRLPKMPALQDFQFYNLPRLTEIYDQEQAYELWKHSQGQKEAAARSQVEPDRHPQLHSVPNDNGCWEHRVTGHCIESCLLYSPRRHHNLWPEYKWHRVSRACKSSAACAAQSF